MQGRPARGGALPTPACVLSGAPAAAKARDAVLSNRGPAGLLLLPSNSLKRRRNSSVQAPGQQAVRLSARCGAATCFNLIIGRSQTRRRRKKGKWLFFETKSFLPKRFPAFSFSKKIFIPLKGSFPLTLFLQPL